MEKYLKMYMFRFEQAQTIFRKLNNAWDFLLNFQTFTNYFYFVESSNVICSLSHFYKACKRFSPQTTQLICYSLSKLCSVLIWAKVIMTLYVQERQFCHDCHDGAILQRATFSQVQLWGWKNVVLWPNNAADKAGRRFEKFFCTALQLIWKDAEQSQ